MTSILTAELRDLLDAYGYLENMITVYERDPGILLAGSGECAKKNVVIGAAKEALNQIAQIFVGYDFKVKRSVDGKIVESGTHESLLASSGLYQKYYEMQFIDLNDKGKIKDTGTDAV
mgnify:CR=1 FL=1